MDLVYKTFNMYKLAIIFLFFSYYANSQVVPIGTIIKGKRLPTLNTDNNPNENNRSATLSGSIKINDSKLSIVENGFIVLPLSDTLIPNIYNTYKYIVSSGKGDFQITIENFTPNTNYKARAYAKNSKGEISYSQLFNFTTSIDPCETFPAPCKNGGSCTFDRDNLIMHCDCTPRSCGDCCAQELENPVDPFCTTGRNFCNAYFYSKNEPKIKLMKTQDNIASNYNWFIPDGLSKKL